MDSVIILVADEDNQGLCWMTWGEENSLKVQVDTRPDVLQTMHTVMNLPGLLATGFGLTRNRPRKLPDRGRKFG